MRKAAPKAKRGIRLRGRVSAPVPIYEIMVAGHKEKTAGEENFGRCVTFSRICFCKRVNMFLCRIKYPMNGG